MSLGANAPFPITGPLLLSSILVRAGFPVSRKEGMNMGETRTRNRRILTEFEQEVIERLDRMEKMLLSLVNDSASGELSLEKALKFPNGTEVRLRGDLPYFAPRWEDEG